MIAYLHGKVMFRPVKFIRSADISRSGRAPLLDELSPEARGIGAVNTVVLKDGKRIGQTAPASHA